MSVERVFAHPATGYDPLKVRAVAEALCRAEGEDPEALVILGTPLLVRHGYAVMGTPVANWLTYWKMAEAAVGTCHSFVSEWDS